ncbi:MAG: cardiolipin synthase [Tannerellaceae bacterium]|jgi:cardiolipin synthase|nr:cardiolipin synthase [Tannerellaceae bacterium]
MFAVIQIQTIVGSILFLLYAITILGVVAVVITENRNPLKTISWVVVLLLTPGLGLLFYFFFGQDNRKQKIISRRTYKRIMQGPQRKKMPFNLISEMPKAYIPLATLLYHNNQSALLYGSRIKTYTNGVDKFNDFMDDLKNAKHHIHLQYYIFCDDEIGNRVKKLLIEKAGEGVKVRVMYDDVGSWNVKKLFFKEMTDAGIEVYAFLKVAFPVFTSKVNYRNHRKIVVIDGNTGYVGGMNIADRYLKGNSLGVWRDSHFRFTGKGVHGLQSAFLIDWYVVSKQLLKDPVYYPPAEIYTKNIMQIATCGPTGHWRTLLQATIYLIANAKKYIYIQTPYFLPTEGLNQALQTAALGGIDIRLMLPERSDTRSANMATHSYLDDMLKAGVKVYFYKPGFLHSKLIIVDDTVTAAGSANMDFRSFEHNFEVNVYMYDEAFAKEMKKIFTHDMQQCECITPARWFKRPALQRLSESFMRLFSPLL